ncbi:MAG: hypothetical protein R3C14_31935 [Caldilineaceae bacterium]
MIHSNPNDHWRPLLTFTLPAEPVPAQQLQQLLDTAVGTLSLPPQLVTRLVTAVSEALLALTVSANGYAATNTILTTIGTLTTSAHTPPAITPSWGFFLVEKRATAAGMEDLSPHQLTIYLYQEGL